MTYIYTDTNRLETPHKYMYTTYEGKDLLRSYNSSRLALIESLSSQSEVNTNSDNAYSRFVYFSLVTYIRSMPADRIIRYNCLLDEYFNLSSYKSTHSEPLTGNVSLLQYDVSNSVNTLDLLSALIVNMTNEKNLPDVKIWADRLLQRFEVTKKLYEVYPPGFRKGDGSTLLIKLYWLFSLLMILMYLATENLKYLNALLKVCDLLCSLPVREVLAVVPESGFRTVILAEIICVGLLTEKKGITFDVD